MKYKELSEF